MNNKLLVLAAFIMLTVSGTINGEEITKKLNDWCTITYPDKAAANSEAILKVKLTNVKDNLKLRGDMHYFKGPSYGGFLAWWGPAVKAENDKEYTMKFKIPSKDGMTTAKALIFLSNDGNCKKDVQKVWTPKIIIE